MLDSKKELGDAFIAGRCQVYIAERSVLAALRSGVKNGAERFTILPCVISKEPLAPAVRRGDDEWASLVRWVLFALILEHVVFFLDDTSQYKGIDTAEINELAKKCDLALVNALKDNYQIVTEPGPDVVQIRMAITDLKQSNPVVGGITTVTMVTPVGLGVGLLKKGATGKWSGAGATSAELMALDSVTKEVIAVGRDEKSAGFTERYGKWDSVEGAFNFWGERLKLFLDQAKNTSAETKQ